MESSLTYSRLCDRLINEVISSGSRHAQEIKKYFRIDLENYSWVEPYLRDLKKREKVRELEGEIVKVQNSLIGKEKVKEDFIEWRKETKKEFLDLIRKNLLEVQGRRKDFDGLACDAEMRLFRCLLISSLSDKEIEEIFKDIPDGVSQSEIDKKVRGLEGEIRKLTEELNKSLARKDRWIYSESGEPLPWPEGCRWRIFVENWERLQSHFSKPVTIEGLPLKTAAEKKAWSSLELDNVMATQPPLRDPYEFDIEN